MREKEGTVAAETRNRRRGRRRSGVTREIVKDKGGDRARLRRGKRQRRDKERKRERTFFGGESLASILSTLRESLQDLSKISSQHCLQKCVVGGKEDEEERGEGGRGDGTMRTRLARHCHPLLASLLYPVLFIRSHPKSWRLSPPPPLSLSLSLFLASRACENSSTQAAFRPVAESVRECSGNVVRRANYPGLMTLPAWSSSRDAMASSQFGRIHWWYRELCFEFCQSILHTLRSRR